MKTKQKSYRESFRDQAVDLLLSSGRPLKQVAETLEMKIKRLERENNYLRRQRDILKKAASILAEDPQGGIR
jgi:transposase-like protein